MYISSCRPAEEGLQKYQTITSLPRRHDQQSGSVRLTQAAGYRDGEQVRRRPEVESNCLGCKHVLTPRSLLLAPRPAASLLGCAPVLVSRPPIEQTVHTLPPWKWEDCSGSPAKAAGDARAPVWHRGSNLVGLVSTSVGPGHHRASIPHSRRPFQVSMVWTTSIKAD